MVEIENLSLSYGQNKKVLKNISLNIKKGECVLFTGKSGSGKSSIINSIIIYFLYESLHFGQLQVLKMKIPKSFHHNSLKVKVILLLAWFPLSYPYLQIYGKKSIMSSSVSKDRTKNFSDYEVMSISIGFLYFLVDR